MTTTTTTITARHFDLPAILDTAKVGDRVRSFDWKGSADCMEGIVTKVEDFGSGCFRYTFEVDTIWESECRGGDATASPFNLDNRTFTRVVEPEAWVCEAPDFHNISGA